LALPGGKLSTGELGAAFTGSGHTAVMVPVFADGPRAAAFGGIQDNTDLFFKMMDAFGFKYPNKTNQ
jgi:alkaline phosphatase